MSDTPGGKSTDSKSTEKPPISTDSPQKAGGKASKSTEPAKAPIGRPPIVFPEYTEPEVVRLAYNGGTDKEIAAVFAVGKTTLKQRFRLALAKGRALRLLDLRGAQMALAIAGNATMLIWLGKNGLSQADVLELGLTQADLEKMSDDQLRAVAAGHPPFKIIQGGARRTG